MQLLARLSQNLPLTLAVLGLLVLAIVIVLALLVRRRRVREEEAAAEPEPAVPLAQTAPAASGGTLVDFRQMGSHQRLSSAFRRATSELRRHLGGSDSRYRLPWFLLLGEAGAEKSRLFQDSGLNLPLGEPEDPVPEHGDGCSFWFFDRGVVLDVSSDFVLRADGKSANERGFRHFLTRLRETRPERPLDGVVLAIPCADLIGPSEEEGARLAIATEKGAALFRKLRQAQESLGMLFPVYVLVTGCDKVPGFASFVGEVPRHLRGDLFGWSSPYAPETAYRTEWIDEAFTLLGSGLQRAQVEAFGDQDVIEDPDGVFCFPEEFQEMRGPLRVYLNQVFRASSYHDLLPLRGLYFCGRLSPAEGGVPDLLREPSAVGGSVFVRDVFDRKVFPERDLAHPSSLALIHGGRRLQVLRAVATVLALILTLGVGWGWYQLDQRHDNLKTFLENAKMDLEETGAQQSVGEDEAFRLFGHMAELKAGRFGSVFLPSSWFSPFHGDLRLAMARAWEKIILDTLHQELVVKLDRILAAARPERVAEPAEILQEALPEVHSAGDVFIAWDPQEAPDLRAPTDRPEFKQLTRYGKSLDELEDNVAFFNRLRTTQSLEELSKLVLYLFGRELRRDFFQNSRLYTKALAEVRYKSFQPKDYHESKAGREGTVDQEGQLADAFFNRLFDRSSVLADLRRAARLVEDLESSGRSPLRGGAVPAVAELSAVLSRVADELTSPGVAWMGGATFRPGPDYDRLIQEMRANPFLGPKTADDLRKDGEQRFQRFQRELFAVKTRSTGALLQRDPKTGALSLSPLSKLLAKSLGSLSNEGFVSTAGAAQGSVTLPPLRRVIWDTVALEQATALYEPYEGFIQKTLATFPLDLRSTLAASARNQAGLDMMEKTVNAQQEGPRPDTSSSLLLARALDAQVASFQSAAPTLKRLAGLFEKLGLPSFRDQVNDALAAQGQQILDDANLLLDLEDPYTPKGSGFGWWDGSPKPALEAFAAGDEGELAAYLAAQRASVAEISSHYVEPVMEVLGGSTGIASRKLLSAAAPLNAISEQLKAYKAKEPGNSVAALEELITKDLMEIVPVNCSSRITPKMLSEPAGDLFALRRAFLRRQVLQRCRVLSDSKAAEGYRRIEAFFNQRLAGHFPFSKGLPTRLDTEADPDDVRAFFKRYDADAPIVLSVPKEDRPPGTGDFIEDMGKVRTFFKAFLEDPLRPAGPSFDLAVRFRDRPAEHDPSAEKEEGADQIIRWSLRSGERTVSHPNTVPTIPWTYGTPLRIELQWAKDSPVVPVEIPQLPGVRIVPVEKSPDLQDPKDVQVAGRTAVLEFTGRWSLLTLLRLPGSTGRLEDGDPSLQRLRLSVATRPVDQPQAAPKLARVFIRLGLRAPERKEKPAVGPASAPAPADTKPAPGSAEDLDLKVPDFPTEAPRWTEDGGRAR
jgi:type VI secretion system protein ImpL